MTGLDREFLKFLSEYPLGSKELFEEASRIGQGLSKPSDELKATIKRINGKWLPKGKRSAKPAETTAVQIDIEDAVEERGGKRGG